MIKDYDIDTILRHGLELAHHPAPSEGHYHVAVENFEGSYGCSPEVFSRIWDEIEVDTAGACLAHLFWIMNYLKEYPKIKQLKQFFRASATTLRFWIQIFTKAIAELAKELVSLLPSIVLLYMN